MNRPAIVRLLRERLPSLLAVHAFGSRVQGTARHDSDLDLANDTTTTTTTTTYHYCYHLLR